MSGPQSTPSPPNRGRATAPQNNRHQYTDTQLLNDLHRVANLLHQTSLSQTDYAHLGRYSFITICRRFRSWKSALAQIHLQPAHHMNITPNQLLADITRVAAHLNTRQLRYSQYAAHGQYSRKIIYRLFKTWQSAATTAGLNPVIQRPQSTSDLIENLTAVYQKLGRRPRYEELRPPLSQFGVTAYTARFGTFKKALQAYETQSMQTPTPNDKTKGFPPRTPRTINLRLRYQILRRDHFRCQACGQSPATHPNVRLQVDHIHPWSQGGPTTPQNLQTLCEKCNNGKSDQT